MGLYESDIAASLQSIDATLKLILQALQDKQGYSVSSDPTVGHHLGGVTGNPLTGQVVMGEEIEMIPEVPWARSQIAAARSQSRAKGKKLGKL